LPADRIEPAGGEGAGLAGRPGPGPAACDAHFHVFGPESVYPTVPGTTSIAGATLERYLPVAEELGVGRFVLVQPSAYGPDNRCLLDALAALGTTRARGVVVVGDERPDDATLESWRALGVRGLRCICFPPGTTTHAAAHGDGAEGFAEALRPVLRRQVRLAAELGWHLDVLAPSSLVLELRDVFETAPADVCFAHLGMFPAARGPDEPGFRWFLDLLADPTIRRFAKVTGPYRISSDPSYEDAAGLARAAKEVAPGRLVWGSDAPHLSFPAVRTADMLALVARWFPDEATQRAVLVDNPTLLYGFEEVGT
jgi:2-pyrone-4,6-dicarboxylate lactonase